MSVIWFNLRVKSEIAVSHNPKLLFFVTPLAFADITVAIDVILR